MPNLKKTVRMCIVCRSKEEQNSMLRLQCKNTKLLKFDGFGRSFYMCRTCQDKVLGDIETKRIEKTLFRECKNKDEYIVQLKEILTHGR